MGVYLVTARLKRDCLARLAGRGSEQLRLAIDDSLRPMRGRIIDFFVVSGDYSIVVLVDFDRTPPTPSLSPFVLTLATSSALEDARINRLETPEVVDQSMAAAFEGHT